MAVVLLHGLGVGPRYFGPLVQELGGDVRTPSLRQPLPIVGLSLCLERLLEGPAVVVGNSMGCQYGVELAARRPDLVEALVLVGPTVDPRARNMPRQLGRLVADAWYEPLRLVAIVATDYLTLGPLDTLRQARHALAHRLEELLPEVAAPTLVVRGAHDRLCGADWAREVASLLPDAGLLTVSGAAHAAHFSHPAEVAAAIRRHVAGSRAAHA